MLSTKEFYEVDKDFKGYVDRCANKYNRSVDDVLSWSLTLNVCIDYQTRDKETENKI